MKFVLNPFTGKFDTVASKAKEIIYDGHETVEEILDETLNLGVLHAPIITDGGGLNISWGIGEVYDHVTNSVIETTAGSGTCTDNLVNYLKWVSGTGLTLNTTQTTANEIKIATIWCQTNDIRYILDASILNERELEISRSLREMFPSIVTSGMVVSEDTNATNVWDVTITSGKYVLYGHQIIDFTGFNSRTAGKEIIRWFHSGGVWTSDTSASIDPTKVDNGTALVATNIAKYYRSNFFVVAGRLNWIYPQTATTYNTVAQARAGNCPTRPPGLEGWPASTCLVLRGNDTAFPVAGSDQWLAVRPTIGSGGVGAVSDHGNLAGLADDDHSQYLLASDATNRATFVTNWGDLTDGGATTLHSHTGGAGDVSGPASAVDGNFALFDGITGKLIKDGGSAVGAFDGGGFGDTYVATVNFDAGAF